MLKHFSINLFGNSRKSIDENLHIVFIGVPDSLRFKTDPDPWTRALDYES
jgi:hypothetical protein